MARNSFFLFCCSLHSIVNPKHFVFDYSFTYTEKLSYKKSKSLLESRKSSVLSCNVFTTTEVYRCQYLDESLFKLINEIVFKIKKVFKDYLTERCFVMTCISTSVSFRAV